VSKITVFGVDSASTPPTCVCIYVCIYFPTISSKRSKTRAEPSTGKMYNDAVDPWPDSVSSVQAVPSGRAIRSCVACFTRITYPDVKQ